MSNSGKLTGGAVLAPASPARSSYRRLLVAGSIGTTVEWYDFWCYAIIGPLVFDRMFFPQADPMVGTLAVYSTFAMGFLARPIGGLFFGHIGDRVGRRSILMITLVMMGIASTLIGMLPGYASIGIWAPALLVMLRFLQGFALGGESIGALALILENAPTERRGFFASWCNAAGPIGIVCATALTSVLNKLYGDSEFQSWAWRIPFLVSAVLVLLGVYMRTHVDESFHFTAARQAAKIPRVPVLEVLRDWKASTAAAFFINLVHSSFSYLSTIFMIAYAAKRLGMPQAGLMTGFLVANLLKLGTVPLFARLSDRIGRRPLMLVGIVAAAMYLPVLFKLVMLRNVFYFGLGIVLAECLVHALMWAPEAAFTAELFPTEVRVSGASLGKQVGVVLGGGFAPLIATSLMGRTGGFAPVSVYYALIAAASFLAILLSPESRHRAL